MPDTDTQLAQSQREAREPEEALEGETERRRAKEREMAQAHQVEIRSEDGARWNAWADGRINAALERHENIFSEAVGEALGEIRAGLRKEFRKELKPQSASSGLNCAS